MKQSSLWMKVLGVAAVSVSMATSAMAGVTCRVAPPVKQCGPKNFTVPSSGAVRLIIKSEAARSAREGDAELWIGGKFIDRVSLKGNGYVAKNIAIAKGTKVQLKGRTTKDGAAFDVFLQ